MNITLEQVVSFIVIVVVFIINNSAQIKKIFANKKDVLGVIEQAETKWNESKNELWATAHQQNAMITFLYKEKISDLQARLDITNDTEEAKEITLKINQYTELLK